MGERTNKQKLLVWGYIRNIEKQCKHLNIIPMEINNIVYLYQRICDEWSQNYVSRAITIDHHTAIVTINDNSEVSIYGNRVIKQGIFTWRVKIISFTCAYTPDYPFIGIVVNDEEQLKKHIHDADFEDFGYVLCGGDGDLYMGENFSGAMHNAWKCVWDENESILEIRLDLDKRSLGSKVNDGNFLELFSNIEVPSKGYRLALGLSQCRGSRFQFYKGFPSFVVALNFNSYKPAKLRSRFPVFW